MNVFRSECHLAVRPTYFSAQPPRSPRLCESNPSRVVSASSRAAGIYGAMRRGGRTQSRGDRRGSAEDNLRQQHECIQVRMPLGRAANIFLCATSAVSAALRVNPRCVVSASLRATGIGGAMRRGGRTQSRGDRRGSAEDNLKTGGEITERTILFKTRHECIQVRMLLGR